MSRIRSKDTKPEMIVRRMLHSMGLRYRLHRRDLPGKPDVVFGPARHVIFVHGCFWHQHPGCREATMPTANRSFWEPKLNGNTARDTSRKKELAKLGWTVTIIWECETRDLPGLRRKLARLAEKIRKKTAA